MYFWPDASEMDWASFSWSKAGRRVAFSVSTRTNCLPLARSFLYQNFVLSANQCGVILVLYTSVFAFSRRASARL